MYVHLYSIGTLGSGSDFKPFLQLLGISAVDFYYMFDKVREPQACSTGAAAEGRISKIFWRHWNKFYTFPTIHR